MNLHKNKDFFKDAIMAASQRFGISEIYVEKDYWDTLVLNEIFHSDIADQIVFKGGVLPEIIVDGITNKKGNIRKTVHQFDRFFNGSFGQVREQLIIEATWLGNYESFTIENVGSYIQNLMQTAGQKALIKKYNLQPFKVQALSVERTFCEKIMSLVRFSRVEDPFAALSNKIRHIYDLDQILNDESFNSFFKS